MSKRLICFILVIFLVADLGFSFMQHYTRPLDGDLAGGVVPADDVREVLASPLGGHAVLDGKTYPNPNRFFSHWPFKNYFCTVPFFLQKFTDPIDSVYLACAFFKTFVQAALIFLLAAAATGTRKIFRIEFLAAALLIAPLFQTNGYRIYMGIIDPAVTYVFFYALPAVFALAYFLPLIMQFYHGRKPLPLFIKILWIPLGLVVCLSGPLNPGIVLVASLLIVLQHLISYFREKSSGGNFEKLKQSIRAIPGNYWFYLFPVSLFALYSLFLGKYNAVNAQSFNTISTGELYARLPAGIYYLLTQKPGMALLLLAITLNMVFIRMKFRDSGQKILSAFKWIGFFALLYILLLPLGGYREYRSNVLRYDTIMPVTLCLMFIFANSTIFIFRTTVRKQRNWYVPVIVLVLLIFTNADRGQFDSNACEKAALYEISASKDAIVKLNTDCLVLSWWKITKPEETELNSKVLKLWNITKDRKLYFQE